MITVERTDTPAQPGDVEALLAALETQPGLWMGCDVTSDGLFRKESVACATPALRFCVTGDVLTVSAMSRAGGALLGDVGKLAALQAGDGVLHGHVASGEAVISLLRAFVALFLPKSSELAFYGAFSFDYFRFGSAEPLPEDDRCRMVAYFPERVLTVAPTGAQWTRFGFSSGTEGPVGEVAAAAVHAARDELSPGAHAACVARGIAKLRSGELQSLVLSQAFRRKAVMAPARAFAALRARNPYPAMFFCNLGGGEILFGASPDLQLRADATSVESAPVCGTLRRGRDPVEDMDQTFALLASEKEAAAIALCADSAANEHAAVCEPGSVEVLSHRRPYFFSTIIHAIDHLRGRRRAELDAFDLLLAHATPATVTGLPKESAVRAIAELEVGWRGWYAGAVARLGSDGSAVAYTVLRAARVAGGVAEIRTGGNILVDSDPAKEEEESELKAQTLFRVLEAGGAPASSAVAPSGSWKCDVVPCDDAAQPRLINALAAAGMRIKEGAEIYVLSGVPRQSAAAQSSVLAIGDGAMWLMREAGATIAALPVPVFARRVAGSATPGGFLRELERFEAGWYATHAMRSGTLPEGWQESAVSADGWVLAAQNRARRACTLFFRPDSVLSLRGAAGTRSLRAAFSWLDHVMFAPGSEKEHT